MNRKTDFRRSSLEIALAATFVFAACAGDETRDDDEPKSASDEVTGAKAGEPSGDEGAAGGDEDEADEGQASGLSVSDGPVTFSFPQGYLPPERQVEEQVLPGVGAVEQVTFMSSAAEQEQIAGVSYTPIPDEAYMDRSPAEVLGDARDGALSAMGATILTEETYERDGHPGSTTILTRKVQGRDTYFRLQHEVVDSHLVQVLLIGTERERLSDAVAEEFFESVQIDSDAGAP